VSYPALTIKIERNWVGETGLFPVSTSHTTVRTVRYTAVPCFASCDGVDIVFSYPILNVTFAYCWFPTYLLARSLFRASDIISSSVTFIYYPTFRVQPFPFYNLSSLSWDQITGYYGLGWLLTVNLVSTVLLTPFPHVCETSRGKTNNLHPIYPHHLHSGVRVVIWTSFCVANSSHRICLIMFVFLGPELCRQLPSDSTSQWTPLLLANGWQLHAPITDFHRQVIRHARRTIKNPTNGSSGFTMIFKYNIFIPNRISVVYYEKCDVIGE